MKSILQTERECYLCKSTRNLEKHHVFGGPNRHWSETYGLTVYLCHNCHNEPPYGVHHNAAAMNELRAEAQLKAMEHYGWTVEDFRKIFGRSYIQEEL